MVVVVVAGAVAIAIVAGQVLELELAIYKKRRFELW